ncbi:hypothetical protein D3C87_1341250 [compost metagenome]
MPAEEDQVALPGHRHLGEVRHVVRIAFRLEELRRHLADQVVQLDTREAGQVEVHLAGAQLGEEAAEAVFVPLAADLVQGQVQGLLARIVQVDVDHGDGLAPEALAGLDALMAAHDVARAPVDDDRVHDAELLDAAHEEAHLLIGHPPRVVVGRLQLGDGHMEDFQFGHRPSKIAPTFVLEKWLTWESSSSNPHAARLSLTRKVKVKTLKFIALRAFAWMVSAAISRDPDSLVRLLGSTTVPEITFGLLLEFAPDLLQIYRSKQTQHDPTVKTDKHFEQRPSLRDPLISRPPSSAPQPSTRPPARRARRSSRYPTARTRDMRESTSSSENSPA